MTWADTGGDRGLGLLADRAQCESGLCTRQPPRAQRHHQVQQIGDERLREQCVTNEWNR